MYDLTEELEFIWDWLEEQNPDPDLYNFNSYNPGLSHEQIVNLSKRLPFELPEELFQLYSWKNGVDDAPSCSRKPLSSPFLFISQVRGGTSLEFYPLEDAIHMYKLMQRDWAADYRSSEPDGFRDKKLFPIAGFEFREHLYVDTSQNPAPVVLLDVEWPFGPVRTYKSLTALISTMAECCEMGAYQIIPITSRDESYFRVKINEEKRALEDEIFSKYNS